MQKSLLMLLVINCGLIAYPQGTVSFSNVGPGLHAPVFEVDGVTKVSGSQFLAELFGGPSATSLAAIAMTGFASGTQAGYFFGGVQSINTVAGGGTAWIQVDVWNIASGGSFAQAQASGLPNSWWQSAVFSVTTGNLLTGAGFTPPAILTELGTSPVFLNSVPEPSTFVLAGLGVMMLLGGRRRG